MSQLIRASESGAHLTDLELRATAGLVLAAGFETTVNLLGNGIRMLMDSPDQLAVLRENPQLWPNAVEEILRLESPVQLSARVALRRHRGGRDARWHAARWWSSIWPPPTAILRCSRIRIDSTSNAPMPVATLPFRAAGISVWGRRWRVPRAKSG